MHHSLTERRFFLAVLLVVSLITLYFVRDYLFLIVSSFLFAFICQPLYRWFLRLTKSRAWLALTLLYLSLAIILLIPILGIGAMISQIINDFVNGAGATYISQGISINTLIDRVNAALAALPGTHLQITSEQVNGQLTTATTALKGWLLAVAQGAGSSLSQLIPALFIGFTVFNAAITNNSSIKKFILELSPLDDSIDRLYIRRVKAMSLSMVRGTFIVALVQGTITGLLLWIGGVPYAPFLALLAIVASIIPLGAGIISIPIGLVLIATGHIWQGALQIAGSLLIVSNIDNVLRPRLVSKEANLHPVLVLIGLFAGIATFGVLGAVYGPVLMIIFVTTIEVYLEHFQVKPKE